MDEIIREEEKKTLEVTVPDRKELATMMDVPSKGHFGLYDPRNHGHDESAVGCGNASYRC